MNPDLIHVDLDNPGAACSWMSSICGPHVLEACSPKAMSFHHSASTLSGLATIVGRIEYGTEVRIKVEESAHFRNYSLSLPIMGQQELIVGRQHYLSDQASGIIVSPNERQSLTLSDDCQKLQVVISGSSMHQALEELLQRRAEVSLVFDRCMDTRNPAVAGWWRSVQHWHEELQMGGLFNEPLFHKELEKTLIKGLILAQPNNYSENIRRSADENIPGYLIRARDYLQKNAKNALTLNELETESGVSRFKLFEGFNKYFNATPMAYLKSYRLYAARQDILASRGIRSISDIALEWGFNHLGRFSADYKSKFGESPSHTQNSSQKTGHRRPTLQ